MTKLVSCICHCGSKMRKTTPDDEYGHWMMCGSCELGISENSTKYIIVGIKIVMIIVVNVVKIKL